jgi:hypothetical protein
MTGGQPIPAAQYLRTSRSEERLPGRSNGFGTMDVKVRRFTPTAGRRSLLVRRAGWSSRRRIGMSVWPWRS